jgi:hemoglobin
MVTVRETIFAYAGGAPALLALARAHHARCLADPELEHPFSHGTHPEHVERLAAYWGEVLGGPAAYSGGVGSQSALVAMHSGNGEMADLARRFVEAFVGAADDAGLPDDPELRGALRAYMEWAVGTMTAHPDSADDVPADQPVPHWSWDGLQQQ